VNIIYGLKVISKVSESITQLRIIVISFTHLGCWKCRNLFRNREYKIRTWPGNSVFILLILFGSFYIFFIIGIKVVA